MGICSGRCFSSESLNFTSISDVQESSFLDCDNEAEHQSSTSSLFGILKFKTKYHSKFLNRFWAQHKRQQQSTSYSSGNTSYARLNTSRRNSVLTTIENQNNGKISLSKDAIQLQCLDVGSLLKMNERRDYKRLQCDSLTEGTLSFASSSLDLEWEHEYDAMERHKCQDDVHNTWYNSDEELSSSSSDGKGRSIELSQFSSPVHQLNRQNNNYQPFNTNIYTNSTRWYNRQRRKSFNRSTSTTKLDANNDRKTKTNFSHRSTPDSLEWDVHDDHKFKSEDDSLDQETVELLNEIEWLKNQALIETGDTQWNTTKTQHNES